jgi:hypothetical protein
MAVGGCLPASVERLHIVAGGAEIGMRCVFNRSDKEKEKKSPDRK